MNDGHPDGDDRHPTTASTTARPDPEEPSKDGAGDENFERLLEYLKETRAFDFTGYKRASLTRRVRHQMQQVGVPTFEEYLDFLQVHPDEFTALFNTILINVTSFFRDEDAWSHLTGEIVPALLAASGSAPIRVWSAGCATGQEAYSLAMVFAEAMGVSEFRQRVKIYATDVDEEALAVARQATYPEREIRGLPAGLLEKYFEPVGGRFAFAKELRRNVIFGRNDLVQDAPISRIDLLACRNALMYFNAETQSRIVSRLGFALRPDGVLFLGKAEMLLNHTAVFEPIDLKRRFFRRLVRSEPGRIAGGSSGTIGGARRPDNDQLVMGLRTEAFLASPVAQLVIDGHDRLALVNNRAATLLALSDRDIGRLFQDLEVSYRPAELRSQLTIARDSRSTTWLRDVEWHRSASETLILDIQVVPLVDPRGRLLGTAIMLNDVSRFRRLQDELEAANRQLETAYEELQSTNEELETTNEELQSTVEELETTNEELQSTNEELETMNEELQSMNDELQSTNEELRERTSQIGTLNEFMESVLSSLRAAVVVVSGELVVQVWNRQAEELWGLREHETLGQHLLNLDSGLPIHHLKPLVREVLTDPTAVADLSVEAINRRGRPVRLHVTVTALAGQRDQPSGALIVMEHVAATENADG